MQVLGGAESGNSGIKVLKSQQRAYYTEYRDTIPQNVREATDRRIADMLCSTETWKSASTIFIYASIGAEVDTRAIINRAVSESKRVCLPVIHRRGVMTACVFNGWENTSENAYMIPEPKNGEEVKPSELDLIIAPGLAFDKRGFRLGYGGGYYDRYLANFGGVSIGLCRNVQIADTLPISARDMPVNYVCTENEIITA